MEQFINDNIDPYLTLKKLMPSYQLPLPDHIHTEMSDSIGQ